jgi:hypothetical protein
MKRIQFGLDERVNKGIRRFRADQIAITEDGTIVLECSDSRSHNFHFGDYPIFETYDQYDKLGHNTKLSIGLSAELSRSKNDLDDHTIYDAFIGEPTITTPTLEPIIKFHGQVSKDD